MKNFKFLASLLMFIASVFVGGGVVMAEAVITPLPDAGATITSKDGEIPEGTNVDGALTLKDGSEASPDLFMADVDARITKIRPMSTPIDQISRKAGKAIPADSMEVKYYSVGTRPMRGTVQTAVPAGTTNDRFAVELVDSSMLDYHDTVRFVGVDGYKEDGETVSTGIEFMALVIGKNDNGHAILQPINGLKDNKGNPAIPADTTVVRMGRAAAELDVQTGIFSNVPTPDLQYCQKFIMQVEESTLAKLGKKEVEWNFTDLEEDGIYDMKRGMEGSFLFGIKSKFKNAISKGLVYTTGGIYWMIPRKITVGEWKAVEEGGAVVDHKLQITDTELVDVAEELFTGTGVGNKRKIAIAGSKAMAAFSKVKSETDKIVIRESVEHWELKFKSFDTDFGEVWFIHSEMLDEQGKSDEVVVIDPEFLTKRIHKGWSRDTYDMKALAVRDSRAVVLSEISCLYLRYPKAHAILKLNADKPVITP